MTKQQKLDAINNAIMLINKAIADNTYDNIVMPNMPEVTLKVLEKIKKEIEKEEKLK